MRTAGGRKGDDVDEVELTVEIEMVCKFLHHSTYILIERNKIEHTYTRTHAHTHTQTNTHTHGHIASYILISIIHVRRHQEILRVHEMLQCDDHYE